MFYDVNVFLNVVIKGQLVCLRVSFCVFFLVCRVWLSLSVK